MAIMGLVGQDLAVRDLACFSAYPLVVAMVIATPIMMTPCITDLIAIHSASGSIIIGTGPGSVADISPASGSFPPNGVYVQVKSSMAATDIAIGKRANTVMDTASVGAKKFH